MSKTIKVDSIWSRKGWPLLLFRVIAVPKKPKSLEKRCLVVYTRLQNSDNESWYLTKKEFVADFEEVEEWKESQ